jgi:hypothetical protein
MSVGAGITNNSAANGVAFGENHTISNSGFNTFIGGGNGNQITGANKAAIIAGTSNTVNNIDSAILAGTSNTVSHDRSVVIGGTGLTTTAADQVVVPNLRVTGSAQITGSVKITGTQYHINANSETSDPGAGVNAINIGSGGSVVNASAKNAAIAGGSSNTLGANAYQSFIGGGANNTVNQLRTAIVGGSSNSVTCADATIIGAASSTLQNGSLGFYSVILGGTSNIIDGSSVVNSAIVGGNNNRVSNVARSVVIGGSNITASVADTVYVPNLNVSGSSIFRQSTVFSGSIRGEVNALSISSNTASLDCALDNFYTLQLVSGTNTFINPSNILPGQTINLRINTTGSATVSFPSSVLQASGSAYVPTATAGVDVVTFISFDSTSLLLSNVRNFV